MSQVPKWTQTKWVNTNLKINFGKNLFGTRCQVLGTRITPRFKINLMVGVRFFLLRFVLKEVKK